MNLLLDTHVLLWWLADDPALPTSMRAAISDGENAVAVSAATTWEISIKRALGKLMVPDDIETQIEANQFEPLPMTLADGLLAGSLPRHHDDPFDRMLIAQAQARALTIVTRDKRFVAYGANLLLTES